MVAKKRTKKKEPEQASEGFIGGYKVGLTKEGELTFSLFGESMGLIHLLGLHRFASLRIDQVLGQEQKTGDFLTHEVGKAVGAVNKKVDGIISLLDDEE